MKNIDQITLHQDFFEQFALDIACDLLNRRLVPENDNQFNEVIEAIIKRFKFQSYVNDNPAEFAESISKERMDLAKI